MTGVSILHTRSHIWMTLTTVHWKINPLLLHGPLLATEYRTTIKSVGLVKWVLAKSLFRVWVPSVCTFIF
jgi:hypothetical protein